MELLYNDGMDNLSLMTMILAIATFLLAIAAFWSIMKDIRLHRKEYRLRLLENILEWLKQIHEIIHENIYDAEKWSSYEIYFKSKGEILKKLLHLSSEGLYHIIPAKITFEKYEFTQKADQYMDSMGKYTDKLHDIVENPLDENVTEDYDDYETDYLNETNDFRKFVIDISVKEH